jgi:ssDNA-binding Zn-finger/Zn-ribbon topoisomerase 1
MAAKRDLRYPKALPRLRADHDTDRPQRQCHPPRVLAATKRRGVPTAALPNVMRLRLAAAVAAPVLGDVAACPVCRYAMDPAISAEGKRTHPCCSCSRCGFPLTRTQVETGHLAHPQCGGHPSGLPQ